MDENERAWVEGVISAQSFLLQNLWAVLLNADADPLGACDRTAEETMRQFGLPVTNRGPMDAGAKLAATNHGEAYLRRFWELVHGRLETAR